jgi:valyl-tRNA synthetase
MKISKSRGGGPMAPMQMIERYSADAVRYAAASVGLGKDTVISEEKIQSGARLVTKLWNVANFSQRFIEEYDPPAERPALSVADRWILSALQGLVRRMTEQFHAYDYAAAKNEAEQFFWRTLADNYLEMAKRRLYDSSTEGHAAARYTLHHALLTMVKLFAPFLPYVTEEIYQGLFATAEGTTSIHNARWPVVDSALVDERAEGAGEALVEIATAVRRYKSDHNLPMSTELEQLHTATEDGLLMEALRAAEDDLRSVTRAKQVEVGDRLPSDLEPVNAGGRITVALR